MQNPDKTTRSQVMEPEYGYAHHDGGVTELESSSMPRHADVTEVAACSFAVLLMITGSAMGFRDYIAGSGIVANAITALLVLSVHQAIGPRALRKNGTKPQFIASLAIAGLALAIAVLLLPLVWGGFASLMNGLIGHANDVHSMYLAFLPGANASDIAAIAFMVAATLLVSLASSILMQRGSRIILPAVLVGLMLLGRGFSFFEGAVIPAVSIMGALMYLAIQTRFRVTARVLAFGALAPVLVAFVLWAICTPFDSLQVLYDARESFNASVREFRYGTDTLPLGRIMYSQNMNEGDDDRLVVSANKSLQNDVLLKGFVGCQWNGSRWIQIDDDEYYGSWQGMMDWFAQNGFDPQTQVAGYDDLSSGEDVQPSKVKLDVDAVGAYRLFVYSPYTLSSTDAKYETNHDAQMNSTALRGARTYSETVVDENPERLLVDDVEDLTQDELGATFAESEMVYRAFVQEEYTEISDEDSALSKRLVFGEDWNSQEDTSLYSMVSRVRLMLQLQALYDGSYAYTPGSASGEGAQGSEQVSFLESFLEDDHRGNSTSFATAAVLAFRSQGVPARYVEGYRLPASLFAGEGSSYTATAHNAEAHAWAEVYRDGVGWIPVEVTPGFYTEIREVTSVVEVERNVEGEAQEDPSQGLVTGATAADQDDDEDKGDALSPLMVFLIAVGSVIALALASLLVLEVQRKVRLGSLRSHCESSDQHVQVRALFDDMSYSLAATGIPFDKGRPEDFADEVEESFPKVMREEYERMLEIMRKSVFGGKVLKAHELNTLVRLAERLNEELPQMNARQRFVSRYRYLR